jgi:predicted phage tail protein
MLRDIYFHGDLAEKYEDHYRLDVDSVAEAVMALSSQLPGFRGYFGDRSYEIIRGDKLIDASDCDHIGLRLGNTKEIHIMPTTFGSGKFGKIILGVAAIGIGLGPLGSVTTGLLTGSRVAGFGFSLLLGGVSSLLAPQPKAPEPRQEAAANESSLFNQVGTPFEGMAIPVIYGQPRVEGIPVSQEIRVIDLSTAVPIVTPGSPGSGTGKDFGNINGGGGGKAEATDSSTQYSPSGTGKS